MRDLTHTKDITEGKAMDAIFNACRANEKREPKGYVTFWQLPNGECMASLFDETGEVLARAIVDQFDC